MRILWAGSKMSPRAKMLGAGAPRAYKVCAYASIGQGSVYITGGHDNRKSLV